MGTIHSVNIRIGFQFFTSGIINAFPPPAILICTLFFQQNYSMLPYFILHQTSGCLKLIACQKTQILFQQEFACLLASSRKTVTFPFTVSCLSWNCETHGDDRMGPVRAQQTHLCRRNILHHCLHWWYHQFSYDQGESQQFRPVKLTS